MYVVRCVVEGPKNYYDISMSVDLKLIHIFHMCNIQKKQSFYLLAPSGVLRFSDASVGRRVKG